MSFLTKAKSFLLKPIGFSRKPVKLDMNVHQPTTQAQGLDGRLINGSPLSGVIDPAQSGRKIRTDWDFRQATLDAETSVWVSVCLSIWATSIGSIPWVIRKFDSGANNWKIIHVPAFEKFKTSPNPHMSWVDLIQRLVPDLFLGGNCLWKKIYSRKKLTAVYPLLQDRVKPVPDMMGYLEKYVIVNGSAEEDLALDKVVHFMMPGGKCLYWGAAPMQPLSRIIECDQEAVNWWTNLVWSGCRKDGIISIKHPLTDDLYDLLINRIRTQLLSNISGRFPLIVDNDVTYTPYDLGPEEMDFLESRKLLREEIIAGFRVPPPLVGVLDKSSNGNLEVARRIFWVDAVIPFLERVRSTLNRCMLTDFIPGSDLENYEIDFDISKVEALAEDFSKKLEQAEILMGIGVPLNVVSKRLELDLPDIEGGDKGYMLNNFVPLEQLVQGMAQANEMHKAKISLMKKTLSAPTGPTADAPTLPGGTPKKTPNPNPSQFIGTPDKPGGAPPKKATKDIGETLVGLDLEEKVRFSQLFMELKDLLDEESAPVL